MVGVIIVPYLSRRSLVGRFCFEAAYLTTPLALFTVTGLLVDGPVMVAFFLAEYKKIQQYLHGSKKSTTFAP